MLAGLIVFIIICWWIKMVWRWMDDIDVVCDFIRKITGRSKHNPHHTVKQIYEHLDEDIEKDGYPHLF